MVGASLEQESSSYAFTAGSILQPAVQQCGFALAALCVYSCWFLHILMCGPTGCCYGLCSVTVICASHSRSPSAYSPSPVPLLPVPQALPKITGKVQVAILGTGKAKYESMVKTMGTRNPNFKGVVKFSAPLAHLITAGADFILVPSRFEPCGLIQLHAMQYGTVPVVASTGGLVDTVKEGVTGFHMGALNPDRLEEADAQAIAATVNRASQVGCLGWWGSVASVGALDVICMLGVVGKCGVFGGPLMSSACLGWWRTVAGVGGP